MLVYNLMWFEKIKQYKIALKEGDDICWYEGTDFVINNIKKYNYIGKDLHIKFEGNKIIDIIEGENKMGNCQVCGAELKNPKYSICYKCNMKKSEVPVSNEAKVQKPVQSAQYKTKSEGHFLDCNAMTNAVLIVIKRMETGELGKLDSVLAELETTYKKIMSIF